MKFVAEGYYSLSAFSCIDVMVDKDNYELVYARMRIFGVVSGRVLRHKVSYTSSGRSYFRMYGMRIYLDEVMKRDSN